MRRLPICIFAFATMVASASVVTAWAAGIDNLQLASFGAAIDDKQLSFSVNESQQNSDLNGDGDTDDRVAHIFDANTDKITNLGLAGGGRVRGTWATIMVLESSQGNTDLNSDGDTSDRVLHLFDRTTGMTMNLALAGLIWGGSDSFVAFRVIESWQGNTDLNGDGDASDEVMHILDLNTGAVTNLRLASGFAHVDQNLVAFYVPEFSQGFTDLNGDGDSGDFVMHVFDAHTGIVTNLGAAVINNGGFAVDSGVVALRVRESSQGNTDLNDDGDSSDQVCHIFDTQSTTLKNLGLACLPPRLQDARLAFPVLEFGQGDADLNGDGDSSDRVMHFVDCITGTTTNLGLAVRNLEYMFKDDLLAYWAAERFQGDTDLNQDGDARDDVLHVFDANARFNRNLGLASRSLGDTALDRGIDENRLAFVVLERAQDGVDLNGDGDATDEVLHVFELDTGAVTNVRSAVSRRRGPRLELNSPFLSFGVPESEQGNVDLNADGDTTDSVVHVFEFQTKTATSLRLAAGRFQSLDEGLLAFSVVESEQANLDLNGDGDATDDVLHLATLSLALPTLRIQRLIEDVERLNLQAGLSRKLKDAKEILDDDNSNNDHVAENKLRDFVDNVRNLSGRKIDEADAADLIAEAESIITLLQFLRTSTV